MSVSLFLTAKAPLVDKQTPATFNQLAFGVTVISSNATKVAFLQGTQFGTLHCCWLQRLGDMLPKFDKSMTLYPPHHRLYPAILSQFLSMSMSP
jgi:hypothetical protein